MKVRRSPIFDSVHPADLTCKCPSLRVKGRPSVGEDAAEINPVFAGQPQQKDRGDLERIALEVSLSGQGDLKWLLANRECSPLKFSGVMRTTLVLVRLTWAILRGPLLEHLYAFFLPE